MGLVDIFHIFWKIEVVSVVDLDKGSWFVLNTVLRSYDFFLLYFYLFIMFCLAKKYVCVCVCVCVGGVWPLCHPPPSPVDAAPVVWSCNKYVGLSCRMHIVN